MKQPGLGCSVDCGGVTARRSVCLSLILILTTLTGGLLIRFAPLGLPRTVMKYGGSALWALVIYWIVSTLRLRSSPSGAALVGGCVATAIELLKLHHAQGLDAFRLTLPGMLLLGRFFSVWDIVVYWLAIGVGVMLDQQVRLRLCH